MAIDRTDGITPAAAGLTKSERWERILGLLAERRRLSVAEAAGALAISESTVRRDFDQLSSRQLARRTHGGIVAAGAAYGLPERYGRSQESVARIAEVAAGAVVEVARSASVHPVIGINGGTTTTQTAQVLGELLVADHEEPEGIEPVATVVTCALNIATDMVLRPTLRTVCLGGTARPRSYELTGAHALAMASSMWLDVLVTGFVGLDPDAGVTCADSDEAAVTKALLDHARTVIAVGAGAKLGQRSFATICPPESVTTVVTDTDAPTEIVAALRERGVEVLLA